MISTKLTTITPQMASQMLKSNTGNRKIRMPHVNRLKAEILAGRWITTHQGIAFDDQENLLDGQHRLMAIEASGKSVQMLVTHGIPKAINGEINLNAMDVIDCGNKRSTSDQLSLMHGVKNTNQTVGVLRMIAYIYTGQNKQARAVTVGQAMAMLEIYGEGIEKFLHIAGVSKISKRSSILGALAMAYPVAPEASLEFLSHLTTGNGIGKGDPAYALREQLIAYPPLNDEAGRTQMVYKVTNCLYNTIQGIPLTLVKATRIGLDYFMSQDKKNVEKVKKIILGT